MNNWLGILVSYLAIFVVIITAKLFEKKGIKPTLINPRYITGIDKDLLEKLKSEHQLVITLEDGALCGGFGEKIASYYGTSAMKVLNYGLKKEFLDRYNPSEILKMNRLTDTQIVDDACSHISYV